MLHNVWQRVLFHCTFSFSLEFSVDLDLTLEKCKGLCRECGFFHRVSSYMAEPKAVGTMSLKAGAVGLNVSRLETEVAGFVQVAGVVPLEGTCEDGKG